MTDKELELNEIKELALEHAKETFLDEQLGYWLDISVNKPPEPLQRWLCDSLRRSPEEAEWETYKMVYKNALRRALVALDALWDDDNEPDTMDEYDAIVDTCAAAMEEKGEKQCQGH